MALFKEHTDADWCSPSTTEEETMDFESKLVQLLAYFPPEMYSLYGGALLVLTCAGLMGFLYLRSELASRGYESGMKTFRFAMVASTIVALVVCTVATVMHHNGSFTQFASSIDTSVQ